jgi:hypothetical protein
VDFRDAPALHVGFALALFQPPPGRTDSQQALSASHKPTQDVQFGLKRLGHVGLRGSCQP